MFIPAESQKNSFLEQTKVAREVRANEKRKENATICLQAMVRGFLARRKYQKTILTDFEQLVVPNNAEENKLELPAKVAYMIVRRYVTFNMHQYAKLKADPKLWSEFRQHIEDLCRYLNKSMESNNLKHSYAVLCLNKDYSLAWIAHIKTLLKLCLTFLQEIKPECHTESIALALFLHTLIIFTSPKSWGIMHKKQFDKLQPTMQKICSNIQGELMQHGFYVTMRTILLKGSVREELTLKVILLQAVITLCTRPLTDSDFSENIFLEFLREILSVPALVYHLQKNATQCIEQLSSICVTQKTMNFLNNSLNLHNFCKDIAGTRILSVLGNLINLFNLMDLKEASPLAFPLFTNTITTLLQSIPKAELSKVGFTQWHELLGWHFPNSDSAQNQNVSLIKKQFHMLWSNNCITLLLGNLLKDISANYEHPDQDLCSQATSTNILRRAFERTSLHKRHFVNSKNNGRWKKLESEEVLQVSKICAMFYAALNTLPQMKLDILTGICFNDMILYNLWLLLSSLGPNCGIKELLEAFKSDETIQKPQIAMLIFFCDCMTHYVTLLDEYEMYMEQKHFQLKDLIKLTYFLNHILFRILYDNLFDNKTGIQNQLFISLHNLLLCLYRRDSRRSFAPANHWLIMEIKPSALINDLENNKKHAVMLLQKMPHIIPHQDRVKLFRKFVQNEKSVMGLTENACSSPRSALIVIHRDRIVEDGYRQLAALKPHTLKGVIRVRFINQQGLHEAGIDQDGVFKEFLEETIKKVFDPTLNLFKTTSDQRLYPSPISYMTENHLQLFEFVGRMLGKAVYEGIVVEVPFASFFLSQLLGQTHQALYSCMDELPSFDEELYRSLTFIKHYKGDVADLNLSFSVDQDVMGKVVTHELHPGGKARFVTNQNKLVYIHYMAHFHINTQIREQTQAFNRGFRSIVNPEWLLLFSPPELQRLISGDIMPLDLRDLRKHTQYYGGFHDSHRVICWLWDILAKDFSDQERNLFLKFVTSCSKPPLLGFAHLEPPFSIRCVEVNDDDDVGDTIGSVIRGFFTIQRKTPFNRLPTSSTCFNLLKLPNYQKKSTLRDKLRYAINSNTGFELS